MEEVSPCIGIVSTGLPVARRTNGGVVTRPAGHYCRIAQEAAKLGATVVLFVPSQVRWSRGQVAGWSPAVSTRSFGNWVFRVHKLPDVIYENVFVHLAVAGYSSGLRADARRHRIPLFNPAMPGKWLMTQQLLRSDCRAYQPSTIRLDDVHRALSKIRAWGTTYVKPNGGYGGNGVTRVEVLADGRYRVSIDRVHGRVRGIREVLNEAQLRRLLRRLQSTPHLVQKGIRLLTIGGRAIDFRVVVHRGSLGVWHVVGIVPKQAARDGVVTNLIAGGERLTLDQCIRSARQEGKTIPVAALRECAIRIATLLSKQNPQVGLAGFDLGVDAGNHVYMIEMNPKPARSLLTDDMCSTLARLQAEFALYLAGVHAKSRTR